MIIELKKFGEVLTSRPAGREAYLAMQAYTIKGLSKDEPIEIDFAGVKVLAPSWADEVITKIKRSFENVKLINAENSSVQATLKTLEKYSESKYGKINKETEEKLRYFFTQETWHTGHPSDLTRFYQFVAEAYRNDDTSISADEFFRIIKETGKYNDNFEKKVGEYHSKYDNAIEVIKVFDRGEL